VSSRGKCWTAEEDNFQSGSFRHFEVDSQHIYEDTYSEIVSSDTVVTKSGNIPHQDSPNSFVRLRKSCSEPAYSKSDGLRSPHWPPYMPPTPPIPHEYCTPSPGSSSCPQCVHSTPSFGAKLDYDSSSQRRRVRFSDSVSIRIIFGGAGDDGRDLVVDTKLVDVFPLRPCFRVGPIRVVVVAPFTVRLSCFPGTAVSASSRPLVTLRSFLSQLEPKYFIWATVSVRKISRALANSFSGIMLIDCYALVNTGFCSFFS